MNAPLRHALAVALALALAGTATAAVPEEGLAAEGRGDYAAAAAIYREQLAAQPQDAELWQRLSDVEAARGEADAAAEALARVAALRPDDAAAHAAHSRALAVANRPAEALAAIERALALDPDNVDHLLARSSLANWNQDTALAQASLERAVEIAGERDDLLDDIARTAAWQGELDEAIDTMDRYLARFPDDRAAALDAVRFAAWGGDYAGAMERLEDAESRLGSDDESTALKARILAWGGRPESAIALNSPLLEVEPGDYGLNYTQAIALRQSFLPFQAQPYIDRVVEIDPDAKETEDLVRSSALPLVSSLGAGASHYEDSLDIEIDQLTIDTEFVAGERLRLVADAGWREVSAPADSPFAPVTAGTSVDEFRLRGGLRYALSESARLEARIGRSEIDPGDATSLWMLRLDLDPGDDWRLAFGADRERIAVSPRAMSLDLTRNALLARFGWTPDLRWSVNAELRREAYSDDNDRDALALSVNRVMRRSDGFNLDLGAAAAWESFDFDPGNGYYAPDSYRRLQLTGLAYWRISDDVGFNLGAALGVQRDETLSSWESANDLSAEAVFGIFDRWELRARAAYSERRQATGAFDATSVSFTLSRRF